MTDTILRSYTRGSVVVQSAIFPIEEAVGGAVSTRLGDGFLNTGPTTFAVTIDIGDASADRLIVVAYRYNNDSISGQAVTVGGVGLTSILTHLSAGTGAGGHYLEIWAGLVTTGSGSQSITTGSVTGSSYFTRTMTAWSITGLASSTVKDTATGIYVDAGTDATATLSVDAGDFVIAYGHVTAGTPDYAASTEAPDDSDANASASGTLDASWAPADATNASFNVALHAGGASNKTLIAASWA